MMKPSQLQQLVIEPVLRDLNLYSPSAVNLLLGTCAQESRLGTYLQQVNGPALGIYQIEPATHVDVWQHYLRYHPELKNAIQGLLAQHVVEPYHSQLVTNLSYATAIARLIYYRVAEPLPQVEDVMGLARYWKRYYNTSAGRGTVSEFITNYQQQVIPS